MFFLLSLSPGISCVSATFEGVFFFFVKVTLFWITNFNHEKDSLFCVNLQPAVATFLRHQECEDGWVKDDICHLSFELKEKITKTTVKSGALCPGCVNLFSGLTLWPLSSTTWWDLAAGCVWVEVCVFTQRPQSPLNTNATMAEPRLPSTHTHTHTRVCCSHMCRLTCVWPLLSPPSHKLTDAASPPPPTPLLSDRARACSRVHTCVHVCARLLCRSGDQMSGGHGSYNRLSVLWLCVEILWHLLRRFSSNYASQTNPIEHQRDEKSSVK